MTKLLFVHALLDAIARMLRVVKALQDDDFDAAETELAEVHRLLLDTAEELRAA